MRRGNDRDGRGSGRGLFGARRAVVAGALLGVATLTTASRATVVVDHISDGSWKTTTQDVLNLYFGGAASGTICATPVRVTAAGQTLGSISGIFGHIQSGTAHDAEGFGLYNFRLLVWNSVDEWKSDPDHSKPATGGLVIETEDPSNADYLTPVGVMSFGNSAYNVRLDAASVHYALNPGQTYVISISPIPRGHIEGVPNMPFASGGFGFGPDLFFNGSANHHGPDTFPNLGAPYPYMPYRVETTSALPGDANYDDRVNFDDLISLAQNYNLTSKLWKDGDFTGDGTVNFDDLVILAQHYNTGVNLGSLEGLSADFASDWALAQALVPEPTTITLFAGMLTLTRRRR